MKLIVQGIIEDTLAGAFAAYADKNVALVSLETPVRGGLLTALQGLDEALQLAAAGTPVVALSIMGEHGHRLEADDFRWHAMLAYTHILYRDGIATIKDMCQYLEEALQLPIGVRDPLALRLLEVGLIEDILGTLAHDLPHAERGGDETLEEWTAKARVLLGQVHTLAELKQWVMERDLSSIPSGPFTGESFPDVCVDVEGTLFDSEGNLRADVVEQVKAEAMNRPVTIWTGGMVKIMAKKVREAGLHWKMVSKHQMRDATVAVAIDDLPQAEFEATYGITVERYIQV